MINNSTKFASSMSVIVPTRKLTFNCSIKSKVFTFILDCLWTHVIKDCWAKHSLTKSRTWRLENRFSCCTVENKILCFLEHSAGYLELVSDWQYIPENDEGTKLVSLHSILVNIVHKIPSSRKMFNLISFQWYLNWKFKLWQNSDLTSNDVK